MLGVGPAQPALGHPPPVPEPLASRNLQTLTERVLEQKFSPAAGLTNDKGDILHFSGRIGKHLEPGAGRANLNVFAMAREGVRDELAAAFSTTLREE